MDPNANLQAQERILRDLAQTQATQDSGEMPYQAQRRARLRELRAALVAWIRGGGFPPDWTTAPRASAWFGRGLDDRVRSETTWPESTWIHGAPIWDAFGAVQIVDAPLAWQAAGLQQTASGYGRQLNSGRIAILPDGRRRRVYVTCFSNAGTAWVRIAGRIVTLPDA